jgi:hypothetical protein
VTAAARSLAGKERWLTTPNPTTPPNTDTSTVLNTDSGGKFYGLEGRSSSRHSPRRVTALGPARTETGFVIASGQTNARRWLDGTPLLILNAVSCQGDGGTFARLCTRLGWYWRAGCLRPVVGLLTAPACCGPDAECVTIIICRLEWLLLGSLGGKCSSGNRLLRS